MPEDGCARDAERSVPGEDAQDVLARIIDQLARLREENVDLRGRVRRLESHSGRGIIHPADFSYGSRPGTA